MIICRAGGGLQRFRGIGQVGPSVVILPFLLAFPPGVRPGLDRPCGCGDRADRDRERPSARCRAAAIPSGRSTRSASAPIERAKATQSTPGNIGESLRSGPHLRGSKIDVAVRLVVHQRDDDRHLFASGGMHFHAVHQHAAIAGSHQKRALGPCKLDANAEGNGAAHGAQVGQRIVGSGVANSPVLGEPCPVCAESTHSTPSSGNAARSSETTVPDA